MPAICSLIPPILIWSSSWYLSHFFLNSIYLSLKSLTPRIVIDLFSVSKPTKTKYMIMSLDQNAGRSHSMKIDNSSIERVEKFKYLGTTLTNKNSIQEEINSGLKLGSACYYSVQNRLSSSLLSKKLKIKIYRTIILPVVLCGCETWSLTLREERKLRVFWE